MYSHKQFQQTDVEVLHSLMLEQPLASLVTLSPAGLDANHIPLLLDKSSGEFGVLRGHVARANSIWRDSQFDTEVLAIFQGVNTYISPSWYATKKETHKVAPTWNYVAVHAYGKLRVIDDADRLRAQLEYLTDTHESAVNESWKISDAPAEYIEKMLAAIVGIEIVITRMEGKWKLNQNRPKQDQLSVSKALRSSGQDRSLDMASLIESFGTK